MYLGALEPQLKTTGLIERFTQTIVSEADLGEHTLSDFFDDCKILNPEQARKLYYGQVYRVKNISPNHLLLRTRQRGGSAFHYIDCMRKGNEIIAHVKTPNSAAYFYIFWPYLIALTLVICTGNISDFFSSWSAFSTFASGGIALLLVGVFFLKISVDAVKADIKKAILKKIST